MVRIITHFLEHLPIPGSLNYLFASQGKMLTKVNVPVRLIPPPARRSLPREIGVQPVQGLANHLVGVGHLF